jgi:hypothetical protein
LLYKVVKSTRWSGATQRQNQKRYCPTNGLETFLQLSFIPGIFVCSGQRSQSMLKWTRWLHPTEHRSYTIIASSSACIQSQAGWYNTCNHR